MKRTSNLWKYLLRDTSADEAWVGDCRVPDAGGTSIYQYFELSLYDGVASRGAANPVKARRNDDRDR